ncbi:MAG: hypothetical protein FWE88_05345 [Phycisphaerae bacterium]|nr:hypothetical protein [Phycisphaerae bacterium]
MVKKRVYVESSVISYLTARPASQPVPRHRQRITAEWWSVHHNWECFVATTVLDEIALGDPVAASQRTETARALPEMPVTPEIRALAVLLIDRNLVPPTSVADAYHLAAAAFHRADYLVTWNQKHLDNLDLRSRIEELIRGWGLTPAKVITPERLLEETI